MSPEKISQITTKTFTPPHPLKTAVLFMVFNRPDTTKQVFEAIRQAKPPRLYVAADGPRADKTGEQEKCEKARQIATQVDWDCEVQTLFRDKNLGCKYAISGGIDWFFENEEEGIILEDDVVPQKEFFVFCQEGLAIWKSNNSIAGIGGFVPIMNGKPFLSIHGSVWGWATWKRAWDNYKQDKYINTSDFHFLAKVSSLITLYEKKIINDVVKKNVDTWDYYWVFSRISRRQYIILPGAPLTSNIGFCDNAGVHLKGDRPKALEKADKIKVTKESINHSLISLKQGDVILTDYYRVYARHGLRMLLNVVRCPIYHPLFGIVLFIIHVMTLLKIFFLQHDKEVI